MAARKLDETSVVDSLYRISSLISETDDSIKVLEVVVDELFRCLNPTSASVSLLNGDSGMLEIEYQRGLPGLSARTPGIRLRLGQGVTGRVALSGKPLMVGDVLQESNYVSLKDSVRSEMATPMIVRTIVGETVQETVVGVMNVDSEEPDAFDGQDLKLLTVLSNEATRVLARLWLFRQVREKSRQLETLVNAGQRVVRQRGLDAIYRAIARDARQILPCRACAIYLPVSGSRLLKLHSLVGLDAPVEAQPLLDPDQSAISVTTRRLKQVSVQDLPRNEEHHYSGFVRDHLLCSMLATPVVFERELFAVFAVYTDRHHRFSNDERRLALGLASLGAVAVQNTHLYERVFQTEEVLRKNDRLTTLGTLASEIAHEIRNPLTVIKLLFESMGTDFAPEDPRSQDSEMILEKINQLEEIVGRVLDFSRSRTGVHVRYDLRTLLEDTLRLVRLKLEQSAVALDIDLGDTPLPVEVHKGQIQQVILNLILNAVQAMPNGGTLTFRAFRETSPSGEVRARFDLLDTGTGIPDNIRNALFQSFLTSRPTGTGLGLAISQRIIKAHRGTIKLVSTSPDGTHFSFTLPEKKFNH